MDSAFYCSSKIPLGGEVDHFIPWAQYPADLGYNLVLADRKCNGQKRHRIPAVTHLERWRDRNQVFGQQITAAVGLRIPCDLPASTRIAYWAYGQAEAVGRPLLGSCRSAGSSNG
jgi:HNH endonuclease